MAYHYAQADYAYLIPAHGPVRAFVLHGYLAVDLFFVLSGFVMALNYQHLFEDGFSNQNYSIFLYKRLTRIYPLYIMVTILAGLIAYAGGTYHAPLTPQSWVLNAALIQSWGFGGSLGAVTWSISTEFAAYILFPLLVAAIAPRRPGWTAAAAVTAVLSLVLVVALTIYQFSSAHG